MRKKTQKSTRERLHLFPEFAKSVYGITVDVLIEELKRGEKDRYVVLSKYGTFVKSKGKSDDRVSRLVKAVRIFFEFHGIEISERTFKMRVKLARGIKRIKKPTDRQEIIEILEAAAETPDLQLSILWHAATGRRPEEIFSIRHTDLDFRRKKFTVRGEYTKMGDEQERPMSDELAKRTEMFIKWKHRKREVVEVKNGKKRWLMISPVVRPFDLLFAPYKRDETRIENDPEHAQEQHSQKLRDLLDAIGKGARISANPKSPRKFTFYRLRDHVKTTISDLGYSDYGEWLIGHQHSTYYNQPEKKQMEIYRKVEPYLTYLDVTGLESRTADFQTQLEEAERKIEASEERHKREIERINTGIDKRIDERMQSMAQFFIDNPDALKKLKEQKKRAKP